MVIEILMSVYKDNKKYRIIPAFNQLADGQSFKQFAL
jgi:hypothetical protein